MSKDFSSFLGKKESKNMDLLGSKKKPKTNLGQTTDKVETNLGQKDIKPKTNLGQTTDKVKTTNVSKISKPKTQPRTKLGHNLRQSADKPKTNQDFSQLIGLQRKVLLLLFDSCQINGSTETSKVTIESLFLQLGNPKSSIQKTLQRIEKKNLIKRKSFKNGRGGWTIYELPKNVYQQVLQYETQDKLRTNLRQSADKPKSQPKTQPKTMVPSSSSEDFNYKNITTTTSEDALLKKVSMIHIPDEVSKIGFSKAHLKQIFEESLVLETVVQQSLDNLASDLRNGRTQRLKSPLGVIVGVLRRGQPYASDAAISDSESDIENCLKRVQSHQELLDQIKKHDSEIALVQKFDEWNSGLSGEQKEKIVTYNDLIKPGTKFEEVLLLEYFRNNLQEDRK